MGDLEKRLATKEEFKPDEGYNLVGLDDFEEPGDELYLIDHYPTRAAATAAQKAKKESDPELVTYIYGPPGDRAGPEVT